MPKVSIIVPVYNTEIFLEKCLSSLVAQTLDDIEIIVVNDGSTDNSQSIINKFCKAYPNKFFSFVKENSGLSDTRNYGIKHSNGEYLGFVDSDDFVEPTMYEEMYKLAQLNNLDLVECDFSWDFPNKSKHDIGSNYNTTEDFYTSGRVMACNKIYKASIIKNNNILFPSGLLYEDVEFFYKTVPHINKSGKLNKIFYHYIQRGNSIINSNNERTSEIFIIFDDLFNYYKRIHLYDKYLCYLEYLYIRIILGSSFLRIVKIKDKNIRSKLLHDTYHNLTSLFPNWKKNIYLNKNKKLKNLYYKSINKFTFRIYSIIFKIL